MVNQPLLVMARMHSLTKGRHIVGGRNRMDSFIVGECICVMIERGDSVYVYWPKKRKAPALTHFFYAYGS